MLQIGKQDVVGKISGRMTKESAEASEWIEIQSTRFGQMTVAADHIITLSRGLLGFPSLSRYALIQTNDNYFSWLHSMDEPSLAFVVTDPGIFFKGYEVPLKEENRLELELADDGFGQVFVICNKVNGWLTANLLGPIVVNASNRTAQQLVLTEKKWSTRQPLLQLRSETIAA
jgi:flagellar assembly factor FliW